MVDAAREYAPRDLRPSTRLVLLLLASRAHERDQLVKRYTTAKLAWDAGLDVRQIRRTLDELEERGLLKRMIPASGLRRGTCQIYYLVRLDEHHRDATIGPPRGTDPGES